MVITVASYNVLDVDVCFHSVNHSLVGHSIYIGWLREVTVNQLKCGCNLGI